MLSTSSNCDVWVWSLDQPAEVSRRLERCLSEDERSRALRFNNPLHGEHYRIAHGMMREILGGQLNIPAADVAFETGATGKPMLKGPIDPDVHFNLSHTSHGGISVAALATSRTFQVGLDVEVVREIEPEIEGELAPDEQSYLASIGSAPQRRSAFFRLWTLKEAALKAGGHGLGEGLDRISIVADIWRPSVAWSRHGLPGPERYQLSIFEPVAGCAGAMAALDLAERLRPKFHKIYPETRI